MNDAKREKLRRFMTVLAVAAVFFSVAVAANAIGMFAATVARSPGEAHLAALLAMLGVVGISGLFVPGGGSGAALVLPFAHLSAALGGTALVPGPVLLSPVSAVLLLAAASALAPRIIRGE